MDTHPNSPTKPMHQFLTAFCLYGLWSAIAWLSHRLGQTEVPQNAAIVLLSGIVATNLLFFLLACVKPSYRPPATTVILAQCVFGIVWGTIYSFLSFGAGELVLGIYMTTFLFAVLRVGRRALLQLAVFSAFGYALVLLSKGFLDPANVLSWPQLIQFLVYLGIIAWLLKFAERTVSSEQRRAQGFDFQSFAEEMDNRAESDHVMKSYNQRYIMESLAREKGRTDRSNTPFSICIFDIDRFSALLEEHGASTSDRILKEFAKRVRSELRAMDTVNPTGIERTFGRFSNEEYVAILPSTGQAGAERCAERIRETVCNRPFEDAHGLTISIGVAEYRRGESISELLARGEQSLRQAIEAGADRVKRSTIETSKPAKVIELHKLKH